MTRAVAALALLLLSSPAFADDKEAMHFNLNAEMKKLAQKNVWKAVDGKFETMLREGIEPTREEWMLGAEAARAIGDAEQAQERYTEALALQPGEEIAAILDDYLTDWGHVLLSAKPGAPGLAPEVRPFQPDRATAIEFAADSIGDDGLFNGLLPAGRYTLSTQPFEIQGGEVKLKINARNAVVDEELARTLVDIPAAPARLERRGTPMFIGAGAGAVIGGLGYALAASANGRYFSDDIDVNDLESTRKQANTWSAVAVGGGVAAVGLGVTGVIVR